MNSTPGYYDLPDRILRNSFQFTLHRKPTFTDSIIPYDSLHRPEHKQAAILFMLNRLNTYELSTSCRLNLLNPETYIMYHHL